MLSLIQTDLARFKMVCLQAGGPGVLQKLGRVLREKAGGDLKQIFQGTAKTREKFGVCACRLLRCAQQLAVQTRNQNIAQLCRGWRSSLPTGPWKAVRTPLKSLKRLSL